MPRFNADKLRQYMKAEKITGRELADRVGLTNVSISRILNGKQQPSRANAERLAEVFGVNAGQFYQSGSGAGPSNFDGWALAALRKDRGLDAEALALRVDAPARWIAELEAGSVSCDRAQRRRLAEALEVEPSSLTFEPAEDFSGPLLRQLRSQRGVGPGALASALSCEPDRILLWEDGESVPSVGQVRRAEQILGLHPGILTAGQEARTSGGAGWASEPSERSLVIDRIRGLLGGLDSAQCLQVLAYVQGLSWQGPKVRAAGATAAGPRQIPPSHDPVDEPRGFDEVSSHELPSGRDWRPLFVPVIDNIAAGAGEETVEAEEFPPGWAESFVAFPHAPEGSFAVRVRGDSMTPRFADGDMLIIEPSRQARSGEVAVVVYEDPDTGVRLSRLKRLRIGPESVVLESSNSDYSPVELPRRQLIRAWPIYAHLPRNPGSGQGPDGVDLSGIRALAKRRKASGPGTNSSRSA
ncbi:MAG: helix-turn-helix domain-containing protein [Planctomycetota bacterium]